MTVHFPAFAPDHPDAEILAAFEKVRTLRTYGYGMDDINQGTWPTGERDRLDEEEQVAERSVFGNFATTPAGVAAQLCLIIPDDCQERWVDRGLMEHGILALYMARKRLPQHTSQQLAEAAYALVYIDWDQAVADYERAAALRERALALENLADALRFGPAGQKRACSLPAGEAAIVHELATAANDLTRATGEPEALDRLVRTLAPDREAYLHKCRLIMERQYDGEVAPWLARDTAFLLGAIPETEQGAA